jgi:hypothetical protein
MSIRTLAFSILVSAVIPFASFGQVELTVSNLPIVVIHTGGQEIPDEPRIVADMGIIYNGNGQTNFITDPYNNYSGKISIELRGSTSQDFPKKSYGLETQNADSTNRNVSLLGMPEENDWILYAPYSDKSLIRNILSYRLSRELGHYAPRTRLCELVVNGDYKGIYVLIEKIKRDDNRVNIATLNPDEISGDDLTGGYIIKVDKATGASGSVWTTKEGSIYFQYHYPEWDKIVDPQENYIRGFMDTLEESLLSDDFKDTVKGYRTHLDERSAIDMFIVNELSRNVDAYMLSYYMYKEKDSDGGKLHMGPLWDYNLAFSNANYREAYLTNGFQVRVNNSIWWWDRLLEDESFLQAIRDRWYDLRTRSLSDQRIIAIVDSLATLLSGSQARNFTRWDILGKQVWPNYYVGESYIDEINYLKSWTSDRLNWLDQSLYQWNHTGSHSLASIASVYPNPFNDHLRSEFTLRSPGTVSMILYDLKGVPVERIIDKVRYPGGTHAVNWDASALPSSIYILSIQVDGVSVSVQKLVKLQ